MSLPLSVIVLLALICAGLAVWGWRQVATAAGLLTTPGGRDGPTLQPDDMVQAHRELHSR